MDEMTSPPPRRGLRFAALAIGVLTDVVGSVATGILLVIAMWANGIPDSEIMLRLNSTSGLLLKLLAVLGFTVIGGFFSGQLARTAYLLHGAMVGAVGCLLSLLCINGDVPGWYLFVHYSGMVPAGITGGIIAKLRYRALDRRAEWLRRM